jgi:hypothetical protein
LNQFGALGDIGPLYAQGRSFKGHGHYIAVVGFWKQQDAIIKGFANMIEVDVKAFVPRKQINR